MLDITMLELALLLTVVFCTLFQLFKTSSVQQPNVQNKGKEDKENSRMSKSFYQQLTGKIHPSPSLVLHEATNNFSTNVKLSDRQKL